MFSPATKWVRPETVMKTRWPSGAAASIALCKLSSSSTLPKNLSACCWVETKRMPTPCQTHAVSSA
eukprot:3096854-Pyramimonas_sp.AAC.1